ncbi:metallophosphoesterase [Gemmatimonadetes bacterium T265]|nr:metallophosphoesterase [Gemmatimonadetes bacterium T265]
MALRVFHVSDLHFGRPAVPAQVEALERLVERERYDVVAVSGDLTQRARSGEFQRAAVFLRDAGRVSHTIVVPGNHDVLWWKAPLGIGDDAEMYANYRDYVSADLEPVLRVPGAPGAVFVGLNTAQGVLPQTLTWNVRDISIIGHLRRSQVERAGAEFAAAPAGDYRVVVMHHNPVMGELSQRHGLKHTRRVLGAFAEIGTDLVLCGHDHQEAVHEVETTKKGTIVSTAGTVSNRSRGGRPSSANVLTLRADGIDITTLVWSQAARDFVPGPQRSFVR